MGVFFTKRFLKEARLLSLSIQTKLVRLIEILKINPYDDRLHTKKLSAPLTGVLSFRVGREYRALFIFESKDQIKLIRVKHRKDIYKNF